MKFSLRWADISLALIFLILSAPLLSGEYYPPRGEWERRAPQTMGFDVLKLKAALILAQEKAVTEPSDLAQVIFDSFNPLTHDKDVSSPGPHWSNSSSTYLKISLALVLHLLIKQSMCQ